jgi:hypothetical protein
MERKFSTLDLALRQRPYVKLPSGTFQSERNYIDFVIDGQSLAEQTRYDLVSVLCKEWALEEREKSVRRLLAEEPADFPEDRRSLLVCAECGDIGCGSVSIILRLSEKTVIWQDFGYQNYYEPEIHGEHLKKLGPFEFDLGDYKSKLIRGLEILRASL